MANDLDQSVRTRRPSRRRVLQLTAAMATLGAVGGTLPGPLRAGHGTAATPPQVWRGTALGAPASISLYHPDPAEGRALIEQSLAEIRRLEAIFSLYRKDTALSRLNAQGVLEHPPLDLLRLLSDARRFGDLTDGAFDVTVQPLWILYAAHFTAGGTLSNGPSERALAKARSLVDYRAMTLNGQRVAFDRPGMAVTLNGIAQGYITDRVAGLLQRAGMARVLIDLGEIKALGDHPSGRPWRVGIKDPRVTDKDLRTDRDLRALTLSDAALATSAGAGTILDPAGRVHHLFDPHSGRSANNHASVTVSAPSATTADALSTAFSALPLDRALEICDALPDVKALFLAPDGAVTTVNL